MSKKTPEVDKKTFELKNIQMNDEKGTFEAVFATTEVVDLDNDKIKKGAIGKQDVIISSYQHSSWNGELPVGKGKVFEKGNEAIVKGTFFLKTMSGKDHYETIKSIGKNQQWSFALQNVDWTYVKENDELFREIKKVTIPEVCPVMKGAGINTRLLDIKNKSKKPEKLKKPGKQPGKSKKPVSKKHKKDFCKQFKKFKEIVDGVETINRKTK